MTLQQAFITHLRKISKGDVEDSAARKILYGDVDGDGKLDVVVQYTLDQAQGNGWGQSLAVFLHKKKGYQLAADEIVGGKYFRWFDVVKIIGHEIIGQTKTCPGTSPQAVCANPLKKQVKLVLVGATLREK